MFGVEREPIIYVYGKEKVYSGVEMVPARRLEC